jgi:hypothetical protein
VVDGVNYHEAAGELIIDGVGEAADFEVAEILKCFRISLRRLAKVGHGGVETAQKIFAEALTAPFDQW